MLGIPIGLLYVNAGEWMVHKYLLHGWGSKKESFWNFHWGEHHRESRKNKFVDAAYTNTSKTDWLKGNWDAQTKESSGLIFAALLHAPLFPVAPFFTGAVWYSLANYHRIHKKSHLDPEWAKQHLPWHYDHHMGPNQHANWCVTKPWFDIVMGTREPYLGTQQEKDDIVRKEKRIRRRKEKAALKAAA